MRAPYSDLWQAVARAVPERIAMITAAGEEWTYARLTADAAAFAATLRRHGVSRGERVAILLYNRPEFLVTFFACLAIGATPTPMNFRFRAGEVRELLDDSDAAALVFPTSAAGTVAGALGEAARTPLAVHVPDTDEEEVVPGISWQEAVAAPGELPASAPDDGELWIYTGGTTGRPKAVRWNVGDMFAAQLTPTYAMAGLPFPATLEEAVAIAVDAATPRVVNLPLVPFMHGTALTTSMNTFSLGGTVLTTSSAAFDPDAALDLAAAHGANRLIVAGDAVALPLVAAAERRSIRLPALRVVQSSGMRFSAAAKRGLHAIAPVTIFDMLASTEGGLFALTTTTGPQDLPGRPRLVPTATVRDAEGREVQDSPGAVGVLAQRGALPLGYHGDEEKTRAGFPVIDGVRHVVPGDWVRVLEDRHIELLGRGSGVINTGGEKVYPQEVEEALLAHPGVGDAAVVGVPDDRFGEIVTAVVTRRDPGLTASALMEHVGSALAGYKKPRHIVFRGSLERTPTGKIVLDRLREEVIADRAHRAADGDTSAAEGSLSAPRESGRTTPASPA
ncbi:AMP-binding protein [Microbacterium lushaniae]|uniref:AMP-binding protein n=1 Tax=Microbacterium lushaniae TaxID=2614639 RepID=A0A5J6L8B4_9MICO|nr:AMP-binding protein [Microbacterium lushaniae]QEW04552.1 AMP-binding protein [Microbacterium lushaniae]